MYTCRQCETEINQGTEICPNCGVDLTLPVLGSASEIPAPKAQLRKTVLRWGVLLTVLLAAIWSFLWFIVPERQGNPTLQAETRATQALRQVQTSLRDYAAAQDSGYPRQLESLESSAAPEVKDARVRAAMQLAQSANYQILYLPGRIEPDGAIRSYVLQARAGNYGFRNFYTDESGVLHATRENRAATAADRPL